MKNHLMNSVTVLPDREKSYPSIIRGAGIYLYDSNNNEYLDAVSGKAGVANIGHGNKDIIELIVKQLGLISVYPTFCFDSEVLQSYLKELILYSPENFDSAWLVTSGSEAVENACKIAYQYHKLNGDHKRKIFIGRQGGYHGNSILGLDIGGAKARKNVYDGLLKGHVQIPAAFCYRCPFNLTRKTCNLECAKSLQTTIDNVGADNVAGFIFEPVAGAALGAVPAPLGYMEEIRKICDNNGILMIADEVMTGFGRVGYNFGVDISNISPDIIAAGKGIGGGYYPLSAVIVSSKVTNPFATNNIPFSSLYSYACNPMGAIVGQFIIKYLLENNINTHVQDCSDYIFTLLNKLRKYEIIGDIRGQGLMICIELVLNRTTKTPFPKELKVSQLFSNVALKHKLIIYPCSGSIDGYSGDHIFLVPPLIINNFQIQELVDKMDLILNDVTIMLSKIYSHL